ncbi:ROK family protein [Clostridium folliculivorans]|uniref:DNA-binding protein n=1 Tax=Clostridium folliculivorans TaxID=2886038 RepID=A0A9W6D7D6_9CLOT|nr:ROK family protein [Clostridium folliculivorans]GKU23205.1 DNA-binding protein [Clostridium folliculivorans]GKU29251.1 DNA-binding protein [Clostridium folliculivorans]
MINAYNVLHNLDIRSIELLKIIQKNGPMTKSKLEDMTKLKKSTLNRELETLCESSIITEIIAEESTGGRKPSLFDMNDTMYYLIGVDISRTYIQIVITNLKMTILDEKTIYGWFSIKEQEEIITENIKELLEEGNIPLSNVIGIGMGVVVQIHEKEELNKNNELKKAIEKNLNLPVFIDNGANTALIAEANFGVGRGKDNLSYVHCGVGIRSAVISSGNIVRTINNSEDAFGHMTVEIGGELCSCGNYGCVEGYASILKITSKFINEVKKGKMTKLEKAIEEVDYIDICNLAENGDETAKAVIIDAAVYFGTGLANFIKILSPQMIILSGPLIEHSRLFYENTKIVALRKCYSTNSNYIEFYKGGFFENKSIAIGAAYLAFDETLKNNFRK